MAVTAMPTHAGARRRWQPWQTAAAAAIASGVAFSVLLISVATGVHDDITSRLGGRAVIRSHLINVGRIDDILKLLTAVVTGAVLVETAVATFVLGTTVMQSRRGEVAIRRQSGVYRSTLLLEFMRVVLLVSLFGGMIGEGLGLAMCAALGRVTVLPVHPTVISILAAFPVAVALAVAATAIPAWKSANASPALLRAGQ